MCKDLPVFDIIKREILNEALMPGAMLEGMSFESWAQHRKSVLSNVQARKVYFAAFGYEAEDVADSRTHMLSLSDCYWQMDENENVTFKSISPYYTEFWDGEGNYNGGAIPTIYTPGVRSKYWIDKDRLCKLDCLEELVAYELAVALDIPCNRIEPAGDITGIIVQNITSADLMLEPAICSGRFKGTFFPTVDEIVESFGDAGLTMLAFDAITGNTDRHLENLGFLRDSNTGEYLGMAPLFDFDNVLTADGTDDPLLAQLPKAPVIENLCERTLSVSQHPVFCARARVILDRYHS